MADKANIYEALKSSGIYSRLWDGTLLRVSESYASRYKKDKDAIKAAKALLHQISGAFISPESLAEALSLIRSGAPEDKILQTHASSRERLPYINDFFSFIFGGMEPASVLDIGCGLNPAALPFMGLPDGCIYKAADIDEGCLDAVREYFRVKDRPYEVFPWDAALGAPEAAADIALCLKLLPTLEMGARGSASALLRGIKAPVIAASFPLKSLGGKSRGMLGTYTAMAESFADECGLITEKSAAIGHELVFIYKKGEIV